MELPLFMSIPRIIIHRLMSCQSSPLIWHFQCSIWHINQSKMKDVGLHLGMWSSEFSFLLISMMTILYHLTIEETTVPVWCKNTVFYLKSGHPHLEPKWRARSVRSCYPWQGLISKSLSNVENETNVYKYRISVSFTTTRVNFSGGSRRSLFCSPDGLKFFWMDIFHEVGALISGWRYEREAAPCLYAAIFG